MEWVFALVVIHVKLLFWSVMGSILVSSFGN
jgi:hypothetical protein